MVFGMAISHRVEIKTLSGAERGPNFVIWPIDRTLFILELAIALPAKNISGHKNLLEALSQIFLEQKLLNHTRNELATKLSLLKFLIYVNIFIICLGFSLYLIMMSYIN